MLVACSGDADETAGDAPAPALVGALELPVSQRVGDALPAGALSIELSTVAIQVAGEPTWELQAGRLPDAVGTKLDAALAKHKPAAVELGLHSSAPYAASFGVLSALERAGVKTLALKVRKASGTESGHIVFAGFDVTDAPADAVVPVPGAAPKTWDAFVSAWSEVETACRAADSGNCAYKPEKVAEGGALKTVLLAAGQGANVHFHRVGVPPAQEPEAAPPAKVEAPAGNTDPAAEAEQAPPATEALFQFRAREALKSPSAITGTLAAALGAGGGGVIVQGEAATPAMRLVSLIGAAFPDGKGQPRVVFQKP